MTKDSELEHIEDPGIVITVSLPVIDCERKEMFFTHTHTIHTVKQTNESNNNINIKTHKSKQLFVQWEACAGVSHFAFST